jgi:hypothetical protein
MVEAVDGCDNASPQGLIGFIYVPHDKRDAKDAEMDCIKTNELGYKKHEPLPAM